MSSGRCGVALGTTLSTAASECSPQPGSLDPAQVDTVTALQSLEAQVAALEAVTGETCTLAPLEPGALRQSAPPEEQGRTPFLLYSSELSSYTTDSDCSISVRNCI